MDESEKSEPKKSFFQRLLNPFKKKKTIKQLGLSNDQSEFKISSN